MRSITLQSIFHPIERTRKLHMGTAILKILGYKFMDIADSSDYKDNPEQYCIDKGIIQHPSTIHMKGRGRLRVKDK